MVGPGYSLFNHAEVTQLACFLKLQFIFVKHGGNMVVDIIYKVCFLPVLETNICIF